jgi:hypothetical protein
MKFQSYAVRHLGRNGDDYELPSSKQKAHRNSFHDEDKNASYHTQHIPIHHQPRKMKMQLHLVLKMKLSTEVAYTQIKFLVLVGKPICLDLVARSDERHE